MSGCDVCEKVGRITLGKIKYEILEQKLKSKDENQRLLAGMEVSNMFTNDENAVRFFNVC